MHWNKLKKKSELNANKHSALQYQSPGSGLAALAATQPDTRHHPGVTDLVITGQSQLPGGEVG